MNWEAIGAIGETVGAMAVIATLFYLAAQVRQNTYSNRRVEYQNVANRWSDLQQLIIRDKDIAHIWLTGLQDHNALDDEEWFRFRMLYGEFSTWLINHWQDQDLLPGQDYVRSFSDIHAYWYMQPSGSYWWQLLSPSMPPDYCSEVLRKIELLKRDQALSIPVNELWLPRNVIEHLVGENTGDS